MMLTAEQRYWQAVQKARLISRRNLEAMLRDERYDSGPCTIDLERQCIIAEIERAMRSGANLTQGLGEIEEKSKKSGT